MHLWKKLRNFFFLVEHFWSSAESWSSVPIILGRFLQNEPVSYAIIAEASTPIFIFLIRSSTSAWPQQLYSWLPTSTMMNSSTTNFKTHRLWLPTWILFRIYNEEIISIADWNMYYFIFSPIIKYGLRVCILKNIIHYMKYRARNKKKHKMWKSWYANYVLWGVNVCRNSCQMDSPFTNNWNLKCFKEMRAREKAT